MTRNKKYITKSKYLIFTASFFFILACNNYKKNKSHESVPDSNISKGKELAASYCQSCHMLPDPSLLDSKTWEFGVLPNMGPRLGIFFHGLTQYPSFRYDRDLDRNFYPSKPVLSIQEWDNIIDYYTSVSPDSLPKQQRKYPVKRDSSLFKIEMPEFRPALPTTCFVHIDTASAIRQVMTSDMTKKSIFDFDSHLKVIDSFQNMGPIVYLEKNEQDLIACNIGVMNPNNGKYGSFGRIQINAQGKMSTDTSMKVRNLARPVQVSSADFNMDGKTDYLVCEFGNLTGALSWIENLGNNNYERHVLRAVPGSIKAYIRDVNGDGLPDIWVLFSQGEEGIFLFTNKGQGKFDIEQVLRFPSIFGSTYFEFADFNNDGYQDIIYTCGDNADFSGVLKPYHGIYIFLNDKSNHFNKEFFFPMNGCFKAMARDFDGDGDLDIAAISFFADYKNQPEETFIYLENKGKLDFQPYSIPGSNAGRWLTMDAGDLDGDGKTDLVLGNFSVAPASIKSATNWKEGPPFIVLKNIMNRKHKP